MKKLFTGFAALLMFTCLGSSRVVAQNTQSTQKPSHVLTDEDMQQRYHNDSANTSDTDTSTDQTNTTTQTDQTAPPADPNDVEGLKKELEAKQKQLEQVKNQHGPLQQFVDSTKKELAASNDDADRASLQDRLDQDTKDVQANENEQKKLEKDVADLKDQIKDAEQNNSGTPTNTTTTNGSTSTTTQTENSNTESTNSNTQSNNAPNNENPQR